MSDRRPSWNRCLITASQAWLRRLITAGQSWLKFLVDFIKNGCSSNIRAVLLVITTPFLVMLFLMLVGWDAVFSISARTEVINIKVLEHRVPRWFLSGSDLNSDNSDVKPFVGSVQLGTNLCIHIERIGTADLLVNITPLTSSGNECALLKRDTTELTRDTTEDGDKPEKQLPLARLFNPDGTFSQEANTSINLRFKMVSPSDKQTIYSLPFFGLAALGEGARAQTEQGMPLLISGKIQVLGKTLFGNTRFAAGKTVLELGDIVMVEGITNGSGANGLIRIDSEPGINVIYHAEGKKAHVQRSGSEGFDVSPSLWSRFSSDPFFTGIAILIIAFLPAITTSVLDRASGNNGSQKGNEP